MKKEINHSFIFWVNVLVTIFMITVLVLGFNYDHIQSNPITKTVTIVFVVIMGINLAYSYENHLNDDEFWDEETETEFLTEQEYLDWLHNHGVSNDLESITNGKGNTLTPIKGGKFPDTGFGDDII